MTANTFFTIYRCFCRNMSTLNTDVLGPIGVRGMKILDREKFVRNIKVPVIKVNEDNLSQIIQVCKKYFLKLENFKPVQNCKTSDREKKKYIHLNPEKIKQWCDITDVNSVFEKNGITEDNFEIKKIQLLYENWKIEQIFKCVLPENEDVVSGFSQIGHIIHLNLRDHLLDYRPLIGQVLLDKIKTCRTVVNKSNIIDNTYRNFRMEVIAGEEDFMVTVKENRCTFEFDFSKVYWNPRLCKEHERIIQILKQGDILFDVFCGVGPFAIPAAKKKCKVFANDLNPDSFKWLNHNAKVNKINSTMFKSYNDDGEYFIKNIFKEYIKQCCNGNETIPNGSTLHVTMNLPAMAVEFLKHFNGLLKNEKSEDFKLNIIVHVYCFAVGDDSEQIARKMVIENINYDITPYITEILDVRNVSPKKEMMRVSFKMPKELLFGEESEIVREPPNKKMCVETI